MDKVILGVFGKMNSGKSSLVNSLAKEEVSIVSIVKGSTSDSVAKMTEIDGVGRVQIVDTAGYDDDGELCEQRLRGVEKVFSNADLEIILCGNECEEIDKKWLEKCKTHNKKYLLCHNLVGCESVLINDNEITLDVNNAEHITLLIDKIKQLFATQKVDILGGLVKSGDTVLLCMPQDDGAPSGRLILPQSVVLRAILDAKAIPVIAGKDNFEQVFEKFKSNVNLVITDSSEFEMVSRVVGGVIPITSFSVLFAKHNGDINVFVEGAKKVDDLVDGDKVLIMEACSHTLSHKDIGRVKIPALITKRTGKKVNFEFLYGKDEPLDWTEYKLVVHCGGCMQNRQFVMSRVQNCRQQNVAITNYGILIAKLTGILDKIVY